MYLNRIKADINSTHRPIPVCPCVHLFSSAGKRLKCAEELLVIKISQFGFNWKNALKARQNKSKKAALTLYHRSAVFLLLFSSYLGSGGKGVYGRKGADRKRSNVSIAPLHTHISFISRPCFVFRFSVFQGQWPSEIRFLKVPTYVGEVHTQMWVWVFVSALQMQKKKRVHMSVHLSGFFDQFKLKKLDCQVCRLIFFL